MSRFLPFLFTAGAVWLAATSSSRAAASADPAASSAISLFPAAGATGVCPDTPLRLTFASPPVAGTGLIRIIDASSEQAVDTIDVAQSAATKPIGGIPGFNYHPVIFTGNEALVCPQPGVLVRGHSYFITLDAGAFQVGGAASAAISGSGSWRYTTRAKAPLAGAARLTVAADGTGDFCTVQGALDYIPEGNTAPVTVFIRKGTYREIVVLTHRNAVTLLGEDRGQTVIAYANNALFNPDLNGNPFGGAKPDPRAADPAQGGAVYRRGLLLAHRVEGLTVANLTLRNTTPVGGSQAESLILNGTTHARAILRDVDCFSFQDTVQLNGQTYLSNCRIEGDVDFMWGTGPCYFDGCTARSLRSGTYYTQIRNQGTNHGFVYEHCTFEGAPGVAGSFLSRIAPARFPASEVVLVDCTLTEAVSAAAWRFDQGGDAGGVHFWEAGSRRPDGQPVDVSRRFSGSRQLTADDAELIANYRSPAFVLGHGWSPGAGAAK